MSELLEQLKNADWSGAVAAMGPVFANAVDFLKGLEDESAVADLALIVEANWEPMLAAASEGDVEAQKSLRYLAAIIDGIEAIEAVRLNKDVWSIINAFKKVLEAAITTALTLAAGVI